jgi:hypothetical protein
MSSELGLLGVLEDLGTNARSEGFALDSRQGSFPLARALKVVAKALDETAEICCELWRRLTPGSDGCTEGGECRARSIKVQPQQTQQPIESVHLLYAILQCTF